MLAASLTFSRMFAFAAVAQPNEMDLWKIRDSLQPRPG
jgi:hypothetical protein